MLTPRQELLLRKVVDGFAATGQPVGSKALAADPAVSAGPSTVREERDGELVIACEVHQAGKRIIRNAEAVVRPARERPAGS